MDELCTKAISSYLETLRVSFETVVTDKGCVLITPFLRSDNEYVELELIVQPEGKVLITDNSDTIAYLFIHGLNVGRSRGLKRLLTQIADRFDVRIERNEIFKLADLDSLGEAIYSILNAVQDVSYLIYKKVRRGPVSFFEEVEKFLIINEVRYDPQFPVQGKSYVHNFRFHLNDRKHMLVEPLTATSPHAALVRAERLAFWWMDIGDLQPQYRKVVVLDDEGKREPVWHERPRSVLEQYSDVVVLWSHRERLLGVIEE
jgi:hypothetical protein